MFKYLICFQALSRGLKFLFQIQAFSRISQAHYEPLNPVESSQVFFTSNSSASSRIQTYAERCDGEDTTNKTRRSLTCIRVDHHILDMIPMHQTPLRHSHCLTATHYTNHSIITNRAAVTG